MPRVSLRKPGETPTGHVPFALKAAQTAFIILLVPAYWRTYPLGNFLWYSDVALLASVPALWLESPLLAGTQALAVVIPESLWAIDYGLRLFFGRSPVNLAAYMFDPHIPRFVRALSLFHLWLPSLFVYLISRVGYDRRSFRYEFFVSAALLLASWRLTRPEDNVNWVYSLRDRIRAPGARAGFVFFLMAAIPLLFQLPVHLALKRLFPAPQQH